MPYSHYVALYNFSAIYIFIPSLPVTHLLGLVAHAPLEAKATHWLMYPVRGGKHHCIFQIIAWASWGASILAALPVIWNGRKAGVPLSHAEAISGAAAVGSVFAELFMIKSLLVFNPKVMAGETLYSVRAVPSKTIAGTAVVGMGAIWVTLAAALVWATEYLTESLSKQVYVTLSGACLLVGITTTYGIGGKYWNTKSMSQEAKTAWKFFQPFKCKQYADTHSFAFGNCKFLGGAAFVATQAFGWALFSSAVISLVWIIAQLALGFAYCIRCYLLITCGIMGGAYLVLGASIWTYQGPQGVSDAVTTAVTTAADKILNTPKGSVPKSVVWLPILALYTPVHLFCVVVALTFFVVPAHFAAAFWSGTLILYYIITSQGAPHHTGCREWPWLREWLRANLGSSLRQWFGTVEVIHDGTAKLDPKQRYVFGYQPHGLFPIGAPYLPLLDEFQQHFPGVNPTPLVASACMYTPVVRDLCSWCGVRQVSRPTFVKALQDRGSVIMVPGGQAELVRTWRFFGRDEFVIYQRHKGFVRLAIEQQASLVPVVCLGEIGALENLFNWPALQQWTYKNIGFPIPFLLVGRWGVTPFPRQTGLRFVVGDPIPCPPQILGEKVDNEVVDSLHRKYYQAVEALYRKHQRQVPGYAHKKFVLV